MFQVGFPTSLMHIQALMNDEVSSMVTHMRKLMGSDHPVLRTLKRLIFHEGKNNLQVSCLLTQFFLFKECNLFQIETKLKSPLSKALLVNYP